jgi:hypothetical protein
MWVQRNMKWNFRSTTFNRNHVNVFITLGELNQSNPRRVSLCQSWQDGPFQNYSLKTCCEEKRFQVWVSSQSFWLVWLFMVMVMKHLFNTLMNFGQMIQILQLGHCCKYFETWKRNPLMNLGIYLNINHKMHFFKDWSMKVFIV